MKRIICELETDPNTIVTPPDIEPIKIVRTMEELLPYMERLEIFLHQGLNLFSYPLDYPDPYFAKEFLAAHDPYWSGPNGPEWFSGMRRYNQTSKSEETCYFAFSDQSMSWEIRCPDSENPSLGFPIRPDEGYSIYMHHGKNIEFCKPCANPTSISLCPPCSNKTINLKKGINWVGIPNPPPDYTSYIMLREIGTPEEVMGISGYNPLTGQWESTYWEFGKPGGENFPILSTKGYMVFMKKEKVWLPGEGF